MFLIFLAVVACFAEESDDVVVLGADNFDEFIKNDYVLVEFFAPWCGHCKKLAPEYAKAATTLKNTGSPVKLGTVDATVESELAEKFGVKGYPTLKFFRSGEAIEYEGGRTEKEIVNWVTKKSGPASKTLSSKEEVDTFLQTEGTRAVAYVSSANAEAWLKAAASEKTQAFAFAHVVDEALFAGNKEGTAQLHKEGEEVKTYDGDFNTADLVQWIVAEGFPLVDELSQDSWSRAQSTGTDLLVLFQSTKDASAALEIAQAYKGKNLIVTVSDQVGIATRWGASGNFLPTVIYIFNKAGQVSFSIWNEEAALPVNTENLKAFVEGSRDGSYESYIKSEPIPENNDGPVTVLVGKNFEEIVKSNKNVLVEFYAPWCGHCKKLAPVFDELGTHYKDDSDVIIAKIDATANGNPKGVSVQGFPTLIFWDANNKQTTYNGERDVEAFKKWIEEHRTTLVAEEKIEL